MHESTTIDIRGTLTDWTADQPPTAVKRVYQAVAPGFGNISNNGKFDRQVRAHVIPTDPQTPPQLARRALLTAGVAAWHQLTAAEQASWRPAGAARGITAFNAYLSNFMTT